MGKMILSTNNYGRFIKSEYNRNIGRLRYLLESMRKNGNCYCFPIVVKRQENGKLKILFGHHRFEAARKLGEDIHYVEIDFDLDIYTIERATRLWRLVDYLVSYTATGKEDYDELAEFIEETGMSVSNAVALFSRSQGGGGATSIPFKEGKFKLDRSERPKIVKEIVECMKRNGIDWAWNSRLVNAVSKITYVPEFNPRRMKQKIKSHNYLLKKQATLDEYVRNLEEVYNRQCRAEDKIPLQHLAQQEANKRNLALNPRFRG